jgi:hypothetical protein
MLFKRFLLIFSILILFSISISASQVSFDNEVYVNPFFFGKMYTPEGDVIGSSSSISNSSFQEHTGENNFTLVTNGLSKNFIEDYFFINIPNAQAQQAKMKKATLYRFFFTVSESDLEIDENVSVFFKID